MKLFNCIAYLTIVSAILIAAAVSYHDDQALLHLLGFLCVLSVGANISLVLAAALRRPDPQPGYDPED